MHSFSNKTGAGYGVYNRSRVDAALYQTSNDTLVEITSALIQTINLTASCVPGKFSSFADFQCT